MARSFRGRPMLLRRSRGYVPEPLAVATGFPRPVLACGAELKNTFCLARGRHAFVSQHIGDLENAETLRSFTEGIEHFRRLFDIDPEVVAHDLHPEYLSTKYALELDDCPPKPSSTTTRTSPPAWPTTAESRPGDRGGLRRDRLRHRRHDLGR